MPSLIIIDKCFDVFKCLKKDSFHPNILLSMLFSCHPTLPSLTFLTLFDVFQWAIDVTNIKKYVYKYFRIFILSSMSCLVWVCHGFRLMKRDDLCWVAFDHFWNEHYFLRMLEQRWKLAQAWNLITICKLSKVKLVRIRETLCMYKGLRIIITKS